MSFTAFSQGGYTIENYHIDVTLTENGIARFTETIDVNFTQKRRGIIREIPTSGKFKGHKQNIWLDDIHVANDRFSVTSGSTYEIKIGKSNKFITGDKQYIISYSAGNGLLNFENHEEFYWNLFGGEWDTDIKNTSFTITLPKDLDMSEEDYQVFSGRVNEKTEYGSIEKNGRTISGKGLSYLGKGRALSVGLRFPKGYFFKQERQEKNRATSSRAANQEPSVSILEHDKTFAAPILLLLGLLFSFFKWGRNKKHTPTTERYYPPNNMTPAEVGTYYDFNVNDRDLLSLIPYWGERGLIKVRVDAPTEKSTIFNKYENGIYLEKQMEIAEDAPMHEKYYFEQIFATGHIVYVDDLKNKLVSETQIAKKMLKDEILDQNLYDQEAVKTFHSAPMVVLMFLSFVLGGLSIGLKQWIITGVFFIILGIVFLIIRLSSPKKSKQGQELHNQLKEFRNTVRKPNDTDLVSIAAKDPKYFDKIFPYAVAFGLDKGWLESFKDIGVEPDYYYYGDGRHFGYTDFSNDFNLKKIQNTMITPPQASSGSSSFSGGGSAGGGFGGGGGSSW